MRPKQVSLVLLVISCICQGENSLWESELYILLKGSQSHEHELLNSLCLKFCVSASLSGCSSSSWERHETLSTLCGICDWVSASHDHWLLLAYTCKNCVCYSNTLTKHRSQVSFSLPYLLTFSVVTKITEDYSLLPSQELEAVFISMADFQLQ